MTQEIYAQLACISSQQSKIRAIRDQLAAFGEAIVKQETDFGELLLVARVPAAYRHCLAECMRRSELLSLVLCLGCASVQWPQTHTGAGCCAASRALVLGAAIARQVTLVSCCWQQLAPVSGCHGTMAAAHLLVTQA